jgi:hypothetical protein
MIGKERGYMIKMLTIVVVFISVAAQAGSLTSTQIILEKDAKEPSGISFVASRNLASWCNGVRGPAHFQSFKAAQTVEQLADGLYVCTGEFVSYPMTPPVDIFSISSCTEKQAAELTKNCP